MEKKTPLTAARQAWDAASRLRTRRLRFKNYTYGRQWEDIVEPPGAPRMSEREYCMASGKEPLTNNMIRQLVKSVVGRFRYTLLNDEKERPRVIPAIDELDARMLEEFLISGCAIQRVTATPGGEVTIDNVSPARFFVNPFRDPRGTDIELIGMLHDMSPAEVVMRYAHGSPSRAARIREIYSRPATGPASLLCDRAAIDSWDQAPDGRCRVIEVWTLEGHDLLKCHDTQSATLFWVDSSSRHALEEGNLRRRKQRKAPVEFRAVTSLRWHGRFYAPSGELLDATESPYAHGSHPFAVKFYPLTDGEVHSFVEDIIDQQRYINRLITLIDHILSSSAKGVLLFPQDQLMEGMTWQDVARAWTNPNGVIPYNTSGGDIPRQIYSGGSFQGASDLLNLEMKLFEQISGVSGALQGHTASPSTGVKLYESQIEHSAIALLDIFETFNSFRRDRDHKARNL